jgi:hypothetical protein
MLEQHRKFRIIVYEAQYLKLGILGSSQEWETPRRNHQQIVDRVETLRAMGECLKHLVLGEMTKQGPETKNPRQSFFGGLSFGIVLVL